jgi:hypothetical protein
MFIPDPGSEFFIPDPGVKKALDPGSGSATLTLNEIDVSLKSQNSKQL